MKKLVILAPVAAILLTAAPAFAADVDSGRITSMNAQTGAIGLDNGHHYTISNPVLLRGVRPGEQVLVSVFGKNDIGFEEDPSQFDGSSGPPAQ